MEMTRYLIVGFKKWGKGNAKLSAKAPSLKAHEISIKLNLDIPDEMFLKPALEADIIIPKESVIAGKIDTEIIDDIKKTVEDGLGISMHVTLIQ
ncbi:MAG: hypothetical protein E2O88_07480 [Bacteroidetes bacterium]|nr:MAG: hypothetical protein E2O88_07480 [Bacteroidota bacterium]